MVQSVRCQPWTATVSLGPGGSLYRDMGKSVCVVVEIMKPEYADTVSESISVTGQLRDSGKVPQLLSLKEGIGLGQGLSRLLFV